MLDSGAGEEVEYMGHGAQACAAVTERARIVLHAYTSVAHLEAYLKKYVESHNKNPQPFLWGN